MNEQLHNTAKIKKKQTNTKSWLFEKIIKMDKPLTRLFKRKRKKKEKKKKKKRLKSIKLEMKMEKLQQQ